MLANWTSLELSTMQKRFYQECNTIVLSTKHSVTCIPSTKAPLSPLEGWVAGVKWLMLQQGSSNTHSSYLLIKTKMHFFPLYFYQWLNLTPLLIFSTANTPPRKGLASLNESREQLAPKGPMLTPIFQERWRSPFWLIPRLKEDI